MNKPLNISCLPYDRIQALKDGRVGIDGYDLHFHEMSAGQIPKACFETCALDVGEVSPANLAMYLDEGRDDWVGMPVFLSRAFRHSYIFVAANSTINAPADLQGARIGLTGWPGTTAIWQRGLLQDEYGINLRKVSWVMAPEKAGGPCGAPPSRISDAFEIDFKGNAVGLADLLKTGEIDAILGLRPPEGFGEDGGSRRLFGDAHAEEVGYFRKTGLFPILHVVAVKKAAIDRDAALAAAIFQAFCGARDHAMTRIREYAFQYTSLPWMHHNLEETVAEMGADYWRYGRARNDHTMQVFLRYCHEQAVTSRLFGVDELFSPLFE